jgi:hypothetical protein
MKPTTMAHTRRKIEEAAHHAAKKVIADIHATETGIDAIPRGRALA